MSGKISALIIAAVLVMPLALAQESGSGIASTSTTTAATKVTDLGPASQASIDAAVAYLKQKFDSIAGEQGGITFGEDYYNRYVEFIEGRVIEECTGENFENCINRSTISFNYKIPFETSDDPKQGRANLILVVLDSKNDIIQYVGPVKAYQFLITKEQAIEKAKSYGLKEITGASVVPADGTERGFEIVWAVSSNDVISCNERGNFKECIYKGVYVDVDTGEIRGEYRINPLILSDGTGGNLGQYFRDQPSTQESPVVLIILVIIIIAAFSLYVKFLRK